MGLIDVTDVDEMDRNTQMIDDEVFEDSDYEEISSVGSAASMTSLSSDDEADKPVTVIRSHCGDELRRVRLRGLLGAGGFGRVFEGELEGVGRQRGRRVAVKLPRSRAGSGGGVTLMDSFLAESALVHLRHPNVVSVLSVGWTREQPADGSRSTDARCDDVAVDAIPAVVTVDMIPAIVMEFAGRRNLQSIIDDPSQTLSLRRRVK